jgi:hypothetical protein
MAGQVVKTIRRRKRVANSTQSVCFDLIFGASFELLVCLIWHLLTQPLILSSKRNFDGKGFVRRSILEAFPLYGG